MMIIAFFFNRTYQRPTKPNNRN